MGQRTGTVYALVDPEHPDRIVYVGATVMYLKQRLFIHCNDAAKRGRTSPVNVWVRSLLARQLRPVMRVLETCRASNLGPREWYWTQRFRKAGMPLLNKSRAFWLDSRVLPLGISDRSTRFEELPELLTASEVAAMCGVSKNVVYGRVRRGQISVVRFGTKIYRIAKSSLLPTDKT